MATITRAARSWPAGLAWALFGLELLLFAAFAWVDHLLRRAGRADLTVLDPFAIPPSVAGLTAGAVGALLASRRPRHPVGWLLLAQGVLMALSGASVGYIPYGLVVRPGAVPGANVVARVYPATISAALAAVGFVLLLTPTGSPPSPRWRRWARGSSGVVAVALVVSMVAPGRWTPGPSSPPGRSTPRSTAAPRGSPSSSPCWSGSSPSWPAPGRWSSGSAAPAGSSAGSSSG